MFSIFFVPTLFKEDWLDIKKCYRGKSLVFVDRLCTSQLYCCNPWWRSERQFSKAYDAPNRSTSLYPLTWASNSYLQFYLFIGSFVEINPCSVSVGFSYQMKVTISQRCGSLAVMKNLLYKAGIIMYIN